MTTIELQIVDVAEKITPKSVLRYRPIGNGNTSKPLTGRHAAVTSIAPPTVQRASRPRSGELTTGPRSRPVPITPHPSAFLRGTKHRAHPLLYLGGGMLAIVLLWLLLSCVFALVTTAVDDLRYGRPRTFQTDQWVGHNEQGGSRSHFIAVNLNRHIEIIELQGGDATHTKIYLGPQLTGTNDDLTPVTLTFADVTSHHKLDMIVNVQGSHIIFINDQGGFRPLLPTEQHQAEQFLQHL